jgi:hypothetical protein
VKEVPVQNAATSPYPPGSEGKWIAWDENQERMLAFADTYPELMERVREMGLIDPTIERAPGVHPVAAAKPFKLLEGESPDILVDVRNTVSDPEKWLDTPNTRLGFKKPRDLIGTTQERLIRYLLRGIWAGITS